MHGGVKFYRGSAAAARSYVEADHSRADDYYLAEGSGLAEHYIAGPGEVQRIGDLDGPRYERWVAGYDVLTGAAKGRLREDARALRFVEVVINGPKSWSLAAALHPDIAAAYDTAMDRAASEVIGWVAEHATTRVGPRGRQVQVPVEMVRPPSYVTTPREPATRTATSTSRSTHASSREEHGADCTRSASSTASRRSTASVTPL
jgi:exodeoxyribonuclease V alpha subunit